MTLTLARFRRSLARPFAIALIASLPAAFPQLTHANVVGADAQNFNPITSGLDFVTVQSSETLKPGIINLGIFSNYAVNSLPYFNDSPQGRLRFNDSLLGLDLNAGVGLMQGWDIGISLPQVLMQSVEDQTGARGEFASVGSTEVRLNSKIRLHGDDSGGVAFVASVNFNRIEDNPYAGSGAGPTTNLEIAADTTIENVAVGANAGYRIRQPGTRLAGSNVAPLGNQLLASVAASYLLPSSTKIIGEIFTSFPAQSQNQDSDRTLTSAEFLVGLKQDVTTNLAFHAGGGTEVAQGLASPDWRVYAGLNYTFGPLFESVGSAARSSAIAPQDKFLVPVATDVPNQERFRTQKILFAFDSDKMVGNFEPALAELASHLKSGFQELIVEGHTDSVGAAAYNEKLSLRRAEAIKRHLSSKYGIDAKKVRAIGYGETRPIADNGNYQGRQENRRVDFEIKR